MQMYECVQLVGMYIYIYTNVHIHTIDVYMRGMHASIILSFPTPFSVNQLHCMFLASSLLLFFLHSFIPEFLPSFHFLIPLLPPFFLPWLLSSLHFSFPSLFCLPSFNFLSGRCFPDIYYGFVQIVLMMMMMMMMVMVMMMMMGRCWWWYWWWCSTSGLEPCSLHGIYNVLEL